MKSIQDREFILEREQKAWRNEKTEISHEIQLLKAERTSSLEKVKPLRTKISGLQIAVASLTVAKRLLEESLEAIKAKVKQAQDSLLSISELDQAGKDNLEALKADLDVKLKNYESEQRKAIEDRLEPLRQEENDLSRATTKLKGEVTGLELAQYNAKKQKNEAISELEITKKSIAHEKTQLEEEIMPLRSDKQHLLEDLEILVGQRTVLTEANVKLQERNAKFKVYWTRAWKILTSKDQELQQREKSLQEKEQLVPISHSFLPPML